MINQMELGKEIEIATIDGDVYTGYVMSKGKSCDKDFWNGFVELDLTCCGSVDDPHAFFNTAHIIYFRCLETKKEKENDL